MAEGPAQDVGRAGSGLPSLGGLGDDQDSGLPNRPGRTGPVRAGMGDGQALIPDIDEDV